MTASYIARPDTAFSASPNRGRHRPREQSKSHLAFIRQCRCASCGSRRNVEAAHLRMANLAHGKAEPGSHKPSDCWVTPLCDWCHRISPDAQHVVGEAVFWERLGIDPFALCLSLWRASGDDDVAETIIQNARKRPA